jgi:orotate phosphoribosyltransferase/uridine monophosphate synthetase
MTATPDGNLWLADALWQLGAIEFGDFTLGHTAVGSPVYLNVRKLISHPTALERAARIMDEEVRTLQSMRHPQMAPFELVAGVPLGGLHIATAFSLIAKQPLIYIHPSRSGKLIEGNYEPEQTAMIIDDLITGGGSVIQTADKLAEAGLAVKDAFVLVDRMEGGQERLADRGIRLHRVLTLRVILNYLASAGAISEVWYRRSLDYLERHAGASE